MLARSATAAAGLVALRRGSSTMARALSDLDAFKFAGSIGSQRQTRSATRAVATLSSTRSGAVAAAAAAATSRVKTEPGAGGGAGAGAGVGVGSAPRRRAHVKLEYEDNKNAVPKRRMSASASAASQARGSSTKKRERSGKKSEPDKWRLIYENIEQMRRKRDAPVDSMGAEMLGDRSGKASVFRYQTLIGLLLSSQTKDEITAGAIRKLQKHGLTPENIANTSEATIGELIYPVGFWRRKSSYIKETTATLLEKYNGDVPPTLEGVVALKGIGPKMGHLIMTIAWGKTQGIGVDVHVHRICNRLGWVRTKKPEETRKALEAWLPEDHWAPINLLLVGFGQQVCKPVKPLCGECLNRTLCPIGRRHRVKAEK